MVFRWIGVSLIAATALLSSPASMSWGNQAQAKGGNQARAKERARHLTIQLNKLDVTTDACRMTFVLTNGLVTDIKEASFELVLFDKGEAVVRLLTVNPGRLPAGKTRVKQFDIKGLSCGNVGRVLLNDVTRCAGDGVTPATCLEAARPRSRIDVPFIN